jgi:synaptojanin
MDVSGWFRLIRVLHGNVELFVGVITEATKAADFEDHSVFAVNRVIFYCITNNKYDRFPSETNQSTVLKPEEQASLPVHPCTNLMKLLSAGSFYFSQTFDITRDLRNRHAEPFEVIMDGMNSDFVWNKSIMSELLRIKRQDLTPAHEDDINKSGILVSVMQGFVGLQNVTIKGQRWKIGIISRLSSNRAGTRFNARGINDNGHVSNFVETEFLIYCGQSKVSFIQVRGSIPLFWEQTGVQVSHKVKISRGLESTIHATKKHFEDLIESYSAVQIVNLLSELPTSPEYELNMAYKAAINQLPQVHSSVRYHGFDFHSIVKRDQYHMVLGSNVAG